MRSPQTEDFDIGKQHGKIERSPAITIFMPALQYESDLFKTTETLRFLKHCQQQALQSDHAKMASLTVAIAPIAPWAVLAVLGAAHPRYFYYDSPKSPATVGLGAAVERVSSGPLRFEQAQAFVHFWQRQFIYADSAQPPTGHFFCSATFFAKAAAPAPERAAPSAELDTEPAQFEPAYVFVPEVQVTTRADCSAVTFNCLMTAATDLDRTVAQIYRQLGQLIAAETEQNGISHLVNQCVTKGVANFERAVTAALAQVQAVKLHKVVLADVMDVVAPQAIDVGAIAPNPPAKPP